MDRTYCKAYVQTDKLVEDLGDWIDQYNLASMILEAINDDERTPTLDMAKDFWYRALEYHLPDVFKEIASSLPDPANEE